MVRQRGSLGVHNHLKVALVSCHPCELIDNYGQTQFPIWCAWIIRVGERGGVCVESCRKVVGPKVDRFSASKS